MLGFTLLYISGYQAANLGSRPGRGIPSEKDLKESVEEGAQEGLGCCLEKPIATSKAVPFQSCHGVAKGLLLLTFTTTSSHQKLAEVF